MSPELRASLSAWKAEAAPARAYQVSRKTNYLGQWILHSGWYPEYHVRLYRRDAQHFVGAIHESVQPRDDSGRKARRIPRSASTGRKVCRRSARVGPQAPCAAICGTTPFARSAEHYAKQDAFTTRAAEELYAQGRGIGG